MMANGLGSWVMIGIAATVTMDVGSALVRYTGLAAGLPPVYIGRWFLGIARGQLIHQDIASAAATRAEVPAAMIGQYVVGVALALVYGWLCQAQGWLPSNPVHAILFGLATNALPWLVMFPAMGYGLLGRKGPSEALLLRSSLANHLFYGIGLWWSAALLLG